MKILIVRGAFLNKFECQNYLSLEKKHDVTFIGSKTSIHKNIGIKNKLFYSPYDIVNFLQMTSRDVQAHIIPGCTSSYHPGMCKSQNKQLQLIHIISAKILWLVSKSVIYLCNRTIGDAHYLIGFNDWIKKTGPYDIVHVAETYYGYTLQAVQCKQKGHINKIVSTCWETISHANQSTRARLTIKKKTIPNIDLFICPTNKAKSALIQEGVDEKNIKVVRVGVDKNIFSLKKKSIFTKNKIKLLFVGRLVIEKGTDDLIKLIEYLEERYPNLNYSLEIVGSGPEKIKLNNFIQNNKLVNKIHIRTIPYSDMSQIYTSSDVLLCLSKTTTTWEEQYGMVLAEAICSGLPIIAYDNGAISEVIGNSGIIHKQGDIRSVAGSIYRLSSNKKDYVRYVNKCRVRSASFDRISISKEIEAIYQSLV